MITTKMTCLELKTIAIAYVVWELVALEAAK
jgi:hypothetical protein